MDLNRNCDLGLVTRLWLDLPKFQVFCLCNILPFCEFLDVLFFYILIVRCRLCRSSDCKPEDHRAKLMSSRDNNNTRERDNNNSVCSWWNFHRGSDKITERHLKLMHVYAPQAPCLRRYQCSVSHLPWLQLPRWEREGWLEFLQVGATQWSECKWWQGNEYR